MKHHILNQHKLAAVIIQHEIRIPLSCLQGLLGSGNIGEKVTTQPDPNGLKFGDKHSVVIMKDGMTVGRLPKDISCLAGRSSSYTGEQLNAKSLERKKNVQKMLRGCLEVPCTYEFDIKGKRCCSHPTAPQRQTEVS